MGYKMGTLTRYGLKQMWIQLWFDTFASDHKI